MNKYRIEILSMSGDLEHYDLLISLLSKKNETLNLSDFKMNLTEELKILVF